jgi:GTP-binding protein
VALNKVDVPDAATMAELVADDVARWLEEVDPGPGGRPRVFHVSTKTGEGLKALTFELARLVAARREAPAPPAARIALTPKPLAGGPEFTVARESDDAGGFFWRVRGVKPERWVRQTDFGNAEAVGYLADRLNRIGVEDRLLELGAEAGDAVAIGGEDAVVFDFAPQIEIGAEILSRRGEDDRLREIRPAARRRRELDAEYHARRAVDQALEGYAPDGD